MQASGYRHLDFPHAPNHRAHLGPLRKRVDHDGISDACAFHELDVDHVRGPVLDDLPGVTHGPHAFVCHYRNLAVFLHSLQAGIVVGLHWLLDHGDAERLHDFAELDRLVDIVSLVRVHPELDPRANSIPHGLNPPDVALEIESDLDLERPEAVLHMLQSFLDCNILVFDPNGHVCDHSVSPSSSKVLVERFLLSLAQQVVDRDVNGGFRSRVPSRC